MVFVRQKIYDYVQMPLSWSFSKCHRSKKQNVHRASFQTAGLKLLSVLLSTSDALRLQYRELARRAGISLGATGQIFEELTKNGHMTIDRQECRQLVGQADLLDRWVLDYAGQLFPRLLIRTCRLANDRSIERLPEELREKRVEEKVLVGGELGAALATGHLRPARATPRIDRADQAKLMGILHLIPDPNGSVDLVERIGTENRWKPSSVLTQEHFLANPLLIYGELLRTGSDERLRETANQIAAAVHRD